MIKRTEISGSNLLKLNEVYVGLNKYVEDIRISGDLKIQDIAFEWKNFVL
jgi:hypothetical protein